MLTQLASRHTDQGVETPKTRSQRSAGFTLVELIAVIVMLGILAAVALPRFTSVSREARIASLSSIAGSMRSTINLVQAKARLAGLKALNANPGNGGQSALIIETGLGRSEVQFSNLCPESSAELGDALDMADYMSLSLTRDMEIITDNQFTRVGFQLSNSSTSGCYVRYDSFALPQCTVEVVSVDC